MIRHNPAGRGHAYMPSLDQRIPHHPRSGDEVEFRVLVEPDVDEVWLDLEVGDSIRSVMASPLENRDSPGEASDGHLAAAAEAGEHVGDLVPWHVSVGPFDGHVRYRFRTADETTDWFEFTPALWVDGVGDLEIAGDGQRLIPGSVRWLVAGDTVIRARFSLRLEDGEAVVGFGERFNGVDQRGRAIDTVVFEQYRSQGDRTYMPVPFALVVGGPGWGFWIETSRRCWFDVGATVDNELTVEVTLGDDPHMKVHIWDGDPRSVLGSFLDVTGRPRPVPDWALRPWMSGNEWNSQERVMAEVNRSLEEDIPVGVVVIEAWSDEGTMTIFRDARYEVHTDGSPHRLSDFTFPEDGAWPDPKGMVEELHRANVKVLLWQIPVITATADSPQLTADRRALVENGYAVREADGSPYENRGWWFPGALIPDFTNPEAARWWTEKRRYLLEDLGIDGFKTDGGEHIWGDELLFSDGSTGKETKNLFPNLYAKAYHDLIESAGVDGVTFSRAGYTGAGRWPAHWAGDEASTWEGFRASITAGLTAGVSGIFAWGWDLAGFSGEIPDPELYLRSAAMACFCPIMQYHSEFNHHRKPYRDRTPWNIAERHDAPEVMDVYRKFAKLRDRLVPYIADELRSGIADARPLMRPLCFDWPDDGRVWDYPYQYMFGRSLLVAPVTEPGVDRMAVYLPEGEWLDAWSGEEVGVGVQERDVPIDSIPVFVERSSGEQLLGVFEDRS